MNPTILFVDDDRDLLDAMSMGLAHTSFDVLCAESMKQAHAILRTTEVTVVVSDERMPESSGIDFLSHVSELYPCVITILFTGRADMATAIRAINEGHVHHFLVKPCALKEVTSILEEAVQLGRIARAGETGPQRVRQERSAIKRLERYHPGITRVHKNEDGSIAIDDPESAAVTSAPDDEPLH